MPGIAMGNNWLCQSHADDEQRKEADARENTKYFDAMSRVMKRYGKEP